MGTSGFGLEVPLQDCRVAVVAVAVAVVVLSRKKHFLPENEDLEAPKLGGLYLDVSPFLLSGGYFQVRNVRFRGCIYLKSFTF